jgi:hypothetical protein
LQEAKEVNVKKKVKPGDTVVILSYEEVLSWLEKNGYTECSRGNWRGDGPTFYFGMQDICGTESTVRAVHSDSIDLANGYKVHRCWVKRHGS